MTPSASSRTSHPFSPPSLSSPSLSSASARTWLLAAGASFSLVAAFSGTATVAAKERPEVDLGRDAEVVLYQYEACPFCNKVKAASLLLVASSPHHSLLDYYDIPYRVVEVNPVGKKELKWSPYKKVPVLVVNGESLVDSSAIISELHRRLNPSKATNIPPAAPAASAAASAAAASAPGAYASAIGGGSGSSVGGTSSSGGGGVAEVVGHVGERGVAEGQAEEDLDEETRWRRWVDGHLVHLLSPNIYRSPSEALEAFDYIATNGNFTAWERMMARYFGAGAMYMIGKKLKKKHGIADERTDLYTAADEWVAALGDRKFLGGETPNLADLAVFGVLRPIRHLTAGRDMVATSSIGPWYERMEQHVGASARITAADGAASDAAVGNLLEIHSTTAPFPFPTAPYGVFLPWFASILRRKTLLLLLLESTTMAAAAPEPRTLERLCSAKIAKHLKRASSLLGSGDLWQMHADADEAKAAAQRGDGAGSTRRPWKMSSMVARIETSLSRFTWRKPPPSPTAPSKPPRSPIAASVTADPPALSPKSPNLASRRFKQRCAAESQIQFRVSPSPLVSAASAFAGLDSAAARRRNAAHATAEENVGRGASAARRVRASLSMDEGQLRAWEQHGATTPSDAVDKDSLDRNDVTTGDVLFPKKPAENLDLGSSGRADVPEGSSARLAHSNERCTQSGLLQRRSDDNRPSSRATYSPAPSGSGRAAAKSPATSGSGRATMGSPAASGGSGRGGSSRAMVVGVSRSLTPPSSPTVKTFSFEAYRQQQMAAQ
ncbi:unnamed protein product [Closterium sp. Yama58-4]|nr:unnamed protein product [Closterium sp. Yama58-4]